MIAKTETPWPDALIRQKRKSAYFVSSVYPFSPAGALGLKPGWLLLQVSAHAHIDEAVIDDARINGITQLIFQAPDRPTVTVLKGTTWPTGMVVIPTLTPEVRNAIRSGHFDLFMLDRIWGEGQWRAFGDLRDDVIFGLLSPLKRGFLRWTGQDGFDLALHSPDYLGLSYLALCALAQDSLAQATAALDASDRAHAHDGTPPMPASFFALSHFIRAQVAYKRGKLRDAKEQITRAVANAPDIHLISEKNSEFCQQPPIMAWSKWMQKRFPVDYVLPRKDALETLDAPHQFCALRPALDTMHVGQILYVMVMGPYRQNAPYFRELIGLLGLHQHDPGHIAAVHLLTERSDAQTSWQHNAHIEQAVLDRHIPLQIGFDKAATLAQSLNVTGFPTVFALDKNGIVLSVDKLDWERGYWTALDRRSNPKFQKQVEEFRQNERDALPPTS